MKKVFMALVGVLAMTATAQSADLSKYAGVYRGFSPTDESAIGLGELEVTIGKYEVVTRMATGLKISREVIPTSRFEASPHLEVASQFVSGSKIPEKAEGFRVRGGVLFIFITDPGDGEALVLRGGIADILGPTFLYSPEQVERGIFQKALDAIKVSAGNVLPTLANNGKRPGL